MLAYGRVTIGLDKDALRITARDPQELERSSTTFPV